MKISPQTYSVLENFSRINPTIFVPKGNVLLSSSPEENVLAEAVVEDAFPEEFYIYDLCSLLGVLKLQKNAEIDVVPGALQIKTKGEEVLYRTADPHTVRAVKKINPSAVDETGAYGKVNLLSEDIKRLNKVAASLKVSDLEFSASAGSPIKIRVHERKEQHHHTFSKETEQVSKTDFSVTFQVKNLDLMDGNYEVTICDKFAAFRHQGCQLTYWISSSVLPSYAKKNK